MHAFNPSSWRQKQADLCEFEASLVYRASPRTVRAVRNPVLKKKKANSQLLGRGGIGGAGRQRGEGPVRHRGIREAGTACR